MSAKIESNARIGKSASEIVKETNLSISKNNNANMFITLFLAIIDLSSGEVQYANAGHNPPVLRTKNETKFLDVISSLPLGAFEKSVYKDQEIKLEKGDILFLYTDGVTEAKNKNDEFFGNEKLLSKISEFNVKEVEGDKISEELVKVVNSSVENFSTDAEQADDITMLGFYYK